MATNAFTEYRMVTPGTSSLWLILNIKNGEPKANGNTTIEYEAYIHNSSTAKWWNQLSQTPMTLTIAGKTVLNTQTGNFDVRTNKTQLMNSGTLEITSSISQISYQWSVDFRNTYDSISGITTISGTYLMPKPVEIASFTIDPSTVNLGQSATATLSNMKSGFNYALYYLDGKDDKLLVSNATVKTTFTIPNSVQDLFPDAQAIDIPLKLITRNSSKEVGAAYGNIIVNLPQGNQKPTIGSVTLSEITPGVQTILGNNTQFLATLSKIRVNVNNVQATNGAIISQYKVRIKERPLLSFTSSTQPFVLPTFNFPESGKESFTIQVAVVDSRGNESDWKDSALMTMIAYQAPSLGIMTPRRGGNNKSIIIKRNWRVSSIAPSGTTSEKNTSLLEFYTRLKGSTNWVKNFGASSTALIGINSEATLSGTFEPNQLYEMKAVLKDKFTTVETAAISIPTETTPMTWSKDKVAVGGIVDKNGDTLQVQGTFSINGKQLQELDEYELAWNVNAAKTGDYMDRDDWRLVRRLSFNRNLCFGVISLNVVHKTGYQDILARLPTNAPTPIYRLQQMHQGGVVYIEAGSREVIGILPKNQPLQVDLYGFFKF